MKPDQDVIDTIVYHWMGQPGVRQPSTETEVPPEVREAIEMHLFLRGLHQSLANTAIVALDLMRKGKSVTLSMATPELFGRSAMTVHEVATNLDLWRLVPQPKLTSAQRHAREHMEDIT